MLHIDMSGTSWLCVTTHVRGPLISLGVGEDVLQEDIGGPPRRPGGLFVVRELGLLVDGLCRVGEGVEGAAAKHLQLPLHAGILELLEEGVDAGARHEWIFLGGGDEGPRVDLQRAGGLGGGVSGRLVAIEDAVKAQDAAQPVPRLRAADQIGDRAATEAPGRGCELGGVDARRGC